MRKELPQKLLRELLKNSKRSDRELAKVLKVSQPTLTRARHRLEKKGAVRDYTIIPDFREMGYEILAVTFAKVRPEILLSKGAERAREFIAKFPSTVFASIGEGMGMNAVNITFYKNFTEYTKRVDLIRNEMKEIVEDVQSFVVPLGQEAFKKFSLTYLGDVEQSRKKGSP